MSITKVCPQCKKPFSIPPCRENKYNFCSMECKRANTPKRNCKKCGKEFSTKLSKVKDGRGSYCSKECWSTRGNTKEIPCAICGKPILVTDSKTQKYCSYECRNLSMLLPDPYYTCKNCGKRFLNRKRKDQEYCSKECFYKSTARTSIEVAVAKTLEELAYKFIEQHKISHYICDFYLPNYKLIIEADGDYWHSFPSAIRRDKAKNTYLANHGYKLLRLTEEKINNDLEDCRLQIITAVQ